MAEERVDALAHLLVNNLLSEHTRRERPETVERARRMMLEASPDGVVAALGALRDRPDSTPLLGDIKVPTLVIGGRGGHALRSGGDERHGGEDTGFTPRRALGSRPPLQHGVAREVQNRGLGRARGDLAFADNAIRLESSSVTRIVHTSDLHFGRPAVSEQLDHMAEKVRELEPDAIAVSGDLTQRCSNAEFEKAREYLDRMRRTAPVLVIPGNHDIRWLGAVARNLGLFRKQAHEFKYSRYFRHISKDLSPTLKVPGAVIAGVNTAHGISRGSLTRRFRDLGVIGHVKRRDVEKVARVFEGADPWATRIVMIHHNPVKGESTGRHGLANTKEALREFSGLGAELVLCGHDHQEAIHTVEETAPGLLISTSGTISNRVRAGKASSFNLVETDSSELRIITYSWEDSGFQPSKERAFPRKAPGRASG